MIVEVKPGQCLVDIAMMYGEVEDVAVIARENELSWEHTFGNTGVVTVSEGVKNERSVGCITTGIEGESEGEWLLKSGEYSDEGVWQDYNYWRD